MFYTVYKITNKINGKYYFGKHITKDLNELRDWYIDCALAFQASEAGLSPVSRSNMPE